MKTVLYRQYSKSGELLYVGISLNYANRLRDHYKGSAWFTDVDNITLEWHETRDEALKAERKAIIEEKPTCNKQHNSQDGIFEDVEPEFNGANSIVMRYLHENTKIFLSKGEVAKLLGVTNFYINGWVEANMLKALQPYLPFSNREVFFIDDIIRLVRKLAEENK
jgi:predicted GIY-YIG superfamily endonuclease